MCMIVDANAAGDISRPTDDGRPVLHWLLNPRRKSGLIVGGRLLTELDHGGLRDTLLVLSRAGRLHRISDDQIQPAEDRLRADGSCLSNDHHVVALVVVSACRLVFTKDQRLHHDLKNRRVVPNRPRIYQDARHVRLLTTCTCPPQAG